jgi:hypothetical protein
MERKTLKERTCPIVPTAKWFNEILNDLDRFTEIHSSGWTLLPAGGVKNTQTHVRARTHFLRFNRNLTYFITYTLMSAQKSQNQKP